MAHPIGVAKAKPQPGCNVTPRWQPTCSGVQCKKGCFSEWNRIKYGTKEEVLYCSPSKLPLPPSHISAGLSHFPITLLIIAYTSHLLFGPRILPAQSNILWTCFVPNSLNVSLFRHNASGSSITFPTGLILLSQKLSVSEWEVGSNPFLHPWASQPDSQINI